LRSGGKGEDISRRISSLDYLYNAADGPDGPAFGALGSVLEVDDDVADRRARGALVVDPEDAVE
jgi:hypothetical protein